MAPLRGLFIAKAGTLRRPDGLPRADPSSIYWGLFDRDAQDAFPDQAERAGRAD
jgi:hypothetical protein